MSTSNGTDKKTMKAFRILAWGKTGEWCEVPIPSPKQGEVLVKMKAAGLCRSDLDMMDSQPGSEPFATAIDAGFTLGHENAGYIAELGPGVSGLKVGESVVVHHMPHCSHCHFCIRGIEQHCETYQRGSFEITRGTGWDGGLAEYMICPRDELVSIGDLDPVKFAPLTDAGVTAYHAIATVRNRLTPGTNAIVIGAGGLGVYAVQFLKMMAGVTVYASDVSEDRLNIAKELGTDQCFKAGPNAAKEVLGVTNGKGVDAILDFVGSKSSLEFAMKISRPQGRVVLVGMNMGTVEVGWNKIATSCEFAISLGSTRKELAEVCGLATKGLLRIDIDEYKFEDLEKAYDDLRNGRLKGRAVVVFD